MRCSPDASFGTKRCLLFVRAGEKERQRRQLLDREDQAGRRAGPAQLLDGETDRQQVRPETAVFLGERQRQDVLRGEELAQVLRELPGLVDLGCPRRHAFLGEGANGVTQEHLLLGQPIRGRRRVGHRWHRSGFGVPDRRLPPVDMPIDGISIGMLTRRNGASSPRVSSSSEIVARNRSCECASRPSRSAGGRTLVHKSRPWCAGAPPHWATAAGPMVRLGTRGDQGHSREDPQVARRTSGAHRRPAAHHTVRGVFALRSGRKEQHVEGQQRRPEGVQPSDPSRIALIPHPGPRVRRIYRLTDAGHSRFPGQGRHRRRPCRGQHRQVHRARPAVRRAGSRLWRRGHRDLQPARDVDQGQGRRGRCQHLHLPRPRERLPQSLRPVLIASQERPGPQRLLQRRQFQREVLGPVLHADRARSGPQFSGPAQPPVLRIRQLRARQGAADQVGRDAASRRLRHRLPADRRQGDVRDRQR